MGRAAKLNVSAGESPRRWFALPFCLHSCMVFACCAVYLYYTALWCEGMSKKATAKKFISELSRLSEETYNSLFTVQQLKSIAGDLNLSCGNFLEFIGSLNNQGYLLQKGSKTYQLMTSAC